jgi:hypothetical protein
MAANHRRGDVPTNPDRTLEFYTRNAEEQAFFDEWHAEERAARRDLRRARRIEMTSTVNERALAFAFDDTLVRANSAAA